MADQVDIVCPGAPQALGPYSQGIKIGNTVYVSGQVPLDPETGLLAGPDIESQTRRVLENLQAIILSVGGGMGNVVKITVYLASLLDFDLMNDVFAEFFPFCPPARTTVEVAALPKDALIEIDAIAVLSASNPSGASA